MKKLTRTAVIGVALGLVSLALGQSAALADSSGASVLSNTGVNGAQTLTLLLIGGGVVVLGIVAIIVVNVRRRNAAKRED